MGQRYADDLESQNDEHLEGLTAKVKLLKDVSPTPFPRPCSANVCCLHRLPLALATRFATRRSSLVRWCVLFRHSG